jgi:hypothetical protein
MDALVSLASDFKNFSLVGVEKNKSFTCMVVPIFLAIGFKLDFSPPVT